MAIPPIRTFCSLCSKEIEDTTELELYGEGFVHSRCVETRTETDEECVDFHYLCFALAGESGEAERGM